MILNLTQKHIFVIGGATGIGNAVAHGFAAEGAHVAIADINPAVTDAVGVIGRKHVVKTHAEIVDVTDFAAMCRACAGVEDQLGPIDHVVFAAGIGSGKVGMPFWNLEPSDWPRVLDVCLLGAVHTLHALVPKFTARRAGTVSLIASVAGQFGSPTDPPYSAAKAGLINFMQVAAKDLAPYNVRVNAINPGLIDTPLQRRIHAGSNLNLPDDEQLSFDEWFEDKINRVIPLRRQQSAQDVANMAVLLASDACSSVTGQCLNVDGGFVMHS